MATDKSSATVKPTRDANADRVRTKAPSGPAAAPRPANTQTNKALRYLGEVRAELRKTTWPTREELISQTQIVLLVLVVIGGFIFVWDIVLKTILDGIFRAIGVH